jgi:hypothetical protein
MKTKRGKKKKKKRPSKTTKDQRKVYLVHYLCKNQKLIQAGTKKFITCVNTLFKCRSKSKKSKTQLKNNFLSKKKTETIISSKMATDSPT